MGPSGPVADSLGRGKVMTTAVTTITGAVTDFLPSLMTVGGTAIGIGAGVLLLTRGWGLLKRFAK